MLPPLRTNRTNTSRQDTPSSSHTVDNESDRIPETQLQPVYEGMAPASLPTTQEGLIALQARHATEMHEAALKEKGRAAELQELELEKARTELELLKGKGTPAAITVEAEPGEITPEALSLLSLHPGVSTRWIIAILNNKFDPLNLCKLRPGQAHLDTEKEQSLQVAGGQVTVRKSTAQMKDYGVTPGVWILAFNTYHSIIDVIHGKAYSELTHAILGFVRQVLELSEVYDWQSQVLPMALEHHRLVMAKGVTNADTWPLPAATRDRYCNHLMVTVPLSKKRSNDGIRIPKSASQSTTTCNNWNNGVCSYENCRRIHACSKCGDALHNALKCKK
jgi:hypothetical protein